MIKKLRARFIIFNMIIIGGILLVFSLYVHFGSKNAFPVERLLFTVLFSLLLVFLGSYVLSGIMLAPIKIAWQKQLDFTADASHELRTPLAIIKSSVEIVKENENDTVKSQEKWISYIEEETGRMTKLTDDLLLLSRADANEQTLDQTKFSLSGVVDSSSRSFESIAKSKNILIQNEIEKGLNYYGDKARISQLVAILIDNAVKYNSDGTLIKVILKKRKQNIIMQVADNGVGIEKENLPKIFDRFYRVLETRDQNLEGSGLGLSIAKWIVTEHKGELLVESEPDSGTTFSAIFHEQRGGKE